MRGKPQEALTHGQRGNPHRSPEPAPAININRAHTGCLQWHYRSVRWKKTSESSTLYDTCRKRLVYIHETRLNADRLVFGLYPPYPARSWLPTTIRIILIQRERERDREREREHFRPELIILRILLEEEDSILGVRRILLPTKGDLVRVLSCSWYQRRRIWKRPFCWLNDFWMKYWKRVIYYFK